MLRLYCKRLAESHYKLKSGSQPRFRNWLPKIANCQVFGHPIFQKRPQYTQITTINMYLLIEIRQSILILCHGIYIQVK